MWGGRESKGRRENKSGHYKEPTHTLAGEGMESREREREKVVDKDIDQNRCE